MALPPDYSGVTSGIVGGYSNQRQQAAQQEGANLQGQRDAINRKAAQLGGGPSGALIKADQQEGDASAQRLQGANANIDQAQAADLRGVQMTQLGQQYTTSEREAGQQFAAGQQQSSQTFQAGQQASQISAQEGMQKTGIDAQSSLAAKQIDAQKLMQQKGLDAQSAMQAAGITAQQDILNTQQQFAGGQAQLARQMQSDEFTAQLNQAASQFDKTFPEQSGVDQFNESIATQMANKKDFLDKLFDPSSWGGGLGGNGSPKIF